MAKASLDSIRPKGAHSLFQFLAIVTVGSTASLFILQSNLLAQPWNIAPDEGFHPVIPTAETESPPTFTVSPHSVTGSACHSCAVLLYGLPRSFGSLVLPSLVHQVIQLNSCDYFVHQHVVQEEAASRSGVGGKVDATEIYQLSAAVAAHDPTATVWYGETTEDEFLATYNSFLEKMRTARHEESGKLLYIPWKLEDFTNATMDNIVKMWNGQMSVWKLMQEHVAATANSCPPYDQVAMMRNDVFYESPLNLSPRGKDVTVPAFAKYPVNDRFAAGPLEAIQVWATERLDRIDGHVERMATVEPGYGMHPERYLHHTIFKAIESKGFVIREDSDLCFLRVRADGTVWVNDCDNHRDEEALARRQATVEKTLGKSCRRSSLKTEYISFIVIQMHCE